MQVIFAQYCWNNKHASSTPALKANFANEIFVQTMLTRCDDDDDVGRQKKMHFKENMYEYRNIKNTTILRAAKGGREVIIVKFCYPEKMRTRDCMENSHSLWISIFDRETFI